ncbi:caspase family protein [Nocardia miyunensis]|uniref:caspase family protein n=1 Tax=Nocardia miyunensis TaxID=282684 RepID=UPI00147186F9|nr:caspase family protein [Nocardia miyunensis]
MIGVSDFPESPDLSRLPAVRENLVGLWHRLTNPDTGVLESQNCIVADPMSSVAELGHLIGKSAGEASDMLLIYYAGHGLLDDRGRLHLATSQTRAEAPKYSALAVDLLREDVGNSAARARVLILDCCFSGRAIETMSDQQGLFSEQVTIAGTYTMTSTTANSPSYSLAGHKYTAFTGALLTALDNPEPLKLNDIYLAVAEDLRSRGLPRPQQRATDTAGALALSRGRVDPLPPTDPLPDEVRFGPGQTAAIREKGLQVMRRARAFTTAMSLGLYAFFAVANHDPGWIWQGVPVALVLYSVTTLFFHANRRVGAKDPTLIIDRTGLTMTWSKSALRPEGRSFFPWKDISHVGVVRPLPGTVNPKLKEIHDANHALIVRLRPEVPDLPGETHFHISSELSKLGYHTIISRIGAFGATKKELLAALDRFAGERVVHSEREFLARDPRLRPDIL